MKRKEDKHVTLDHFGEVHVDVKRRSRRIFNDSLVLTARLSRPSTILDTRRKLMNLGGIACLLLFVYVSAFGLGQGNSSVSRQKRQKSSAQQEETSTQQFIPPKGFLHTPDNSIPSHAPVVAGASFAYQDIKRLQGLSNIATKHADSKNVKEVAPPAPRKRVAAKIVHATRSKISTAEIQAPLKEKPGDAVEAAAHGRRKQQKSKARTAFQSPVMAAESSGVEAASAAEEMMKDPLLPHLKPLP
mmetsp:Transcript_48201/g.151230  ORF Transcript_48201/g.151230 Transcript_48201/m.151230 type:complete len:244 (-) Transcript_48201:88-819(-)